jgi:hypothetical protein
LRILLRVPMQSDNSFSMVRAAGSQQASLLFKNKRLGLTAICSSRTAMLRAARSFKMAAEPTRYRIKGYCGGALRYVN